MFWNIFGTEQKQNNSGICSEQLKNMPKSATDNESNSDLERRTGEQAVLDFHKKQRKKPSPVYTFYEAPIIAVKGGIQGISFKCKR